MPFLRYLIYSFLYLNYFLCLSLLSLERLSSTINWSPRCQKLLELGWSMANEECLMFVMLELCITACYVLRIKLIYTDRLSPNIASVGF